MLIRVSLVLNIDGNEVSTCYDLNTFGLALTSF